MIEKLILKNFKLFRSETCVPLSNINLFTGINGRGKSTVIQALLLMMQSAELSPYTTKIILNGEEVKLGTYRDVRNVTTAPIEFTFVYPDFSIKYEMQGDVDDEMVMSITRVMVSSNAGQEKILAVKKDNVFEMTIRDAPVEHIELVQLYDCIPHSPLLEVERKSINFQRMHYVSADRVGPKLYYEDRSDRGSLKVGATGENTVAVLFHALNQQVDQRVIKKINHFFYVAIDDLGTTVEFQTEFWLDRIFKGAKFLIKRIEDTNLLTFSISSDGSFNYFKPTNVGYGFSYVLPIIVAGLIANPGEILIVENPEAHLHPFAQSILANFLTLVSLKQVQVIVESHSEHILNSFRLAVKTALIDREQLNVLYFDRDPDSYFKRISVDNTGMISTWPVDFFDQATNDLNKLLDI